MIVRDLTLKYNVEIGSLQKLYAVERLFSRLTLTFGAMAAAGVLAFKGIFGEAQKFEDEIAKILAVVDKTENLEAVKKRIGGLAMNLSEEFGLSKYDILEDANAIINLGVKPMGQELEDLLEIMAKFRNVGGDLVGKELSRVIYMTQKQFPENTLKEVADLIQLAVRGSPNFVKDIYQAMQQAGPTAAALNQDLEGTLATLMTMSQIGTFGPKAGTGIKSLLRIPQWTGQTARGMEALGFSQKDFVNAKGEFKTFVDIFDMFRKRRDEMGHTAWIGAVSKVLDRRNVSGFIGAMMMERKVQDDFKQLLDESKGGELSEAWGRRSGTAAKGADRLNEAWSNLMITLGSPSLNPLEAVYVSIAKITEGLRKMLEENPELAKMTSTVMALGAAFTIAAGALGLLFAAIVTGKTMLLLSGYASFGEFAKMIIMAIGPAILFASLLVLLALLYDDLSKSTEEYDTIIKRLGKNSDTLTTLLKWMAGALFLVGFAIMFVFSPVLLLIGLLAYMAYHIEDIIENYKAWKREYELIYETLVKYPLDKAAEWMTRGEHAGLLWTYFFGDHPYQEMKFILETVWKILSLFKNIANPGAAMGLGWDLFKSFWNTTDFGSDMGSKFNNAAISSASTPSTSRQVINLNNKSGGIEISFIGTQEEQQRIIDKVSKLDAEHQLEYIFMLESMGYKRINYPASTP